jgi:FkbM family methyltransferase
VRIRQSLRKFRRTLFELAGNPKYSRPGLYDLDVKLGRYLTKRNGFFVEAGANDGFTQSNTYYLERFLGWRGILVEGIPELFKKARQERRYSRVFNCALGPFDQDGHEVEMVYGNLMSLVKGAMGDPEADAQHICEAKQHDPASGSYNIKAPVRSLTSILDECGAPSIDFLSLDVEGYEGPVLRGIDFKRHKPEFICVEARKRPEVEAILLPFYTVVEQLTTMDVLYRRK